MSMSSNLRGRCEFINKYFKGVTGHHEMPSNSEINNDRDRHVAQADAANQIHQLALQAIDIGNEAKLGFLVYLLRMVVEESKEIATALSGERTISK